MSSLIMVITTQAQEIKVSGSLANAVSTEISFTTNWQQLSDDPRTIVKIKTDDKGAFSTTLPIKEAMPLNLTVFSGNIPMYVQPGDAIIVTGDASNANAGYKFEGKGADYNNYLNKNSLRFGNTETLFSKLFEQSKMNKQAFYKSADSLLSLQRSFMKAEAPKNISAKFTDYMDAEYTYFNTKIKTIFNAQVSANTKTVFTIDNSVFDKVTLNNEKAIQSPEYVQTVLIYYNYKAKVDFLKTHDSISSLDDYKAIAKGEYQLLKKELTGAVRDYMTAKLIKAIKTYIPDSTLYKELYTDYKIINLNKDFLTQIEAREKSQMELQAEQRQKMQEQADAQKNAMVGKPAPSFKFADVNGKEYSIADFKGKVVYLDAWASWCGPCKQQIPAAKELEEKFKGKDVVFLAVSIDANEDAWKKCLTDYSPAGIHVIAKGDGGAFSRNYGIMTIPRYYLIDRNGNIVDADAKRPSMGVETDLEKLLSN